jgi:hypothetical protein
MEKSLFRTKIPVQTKDLSYLPKPTPANPCHLITNPLRYGLFCFTSQRKGENITARIGHGNAKQGEKKQRNLFFGK